MQQDNKNSFPFVATSLDSSLRSADLERQDIERTARLFANGRSYYERE
jgi:hypothetical protein